MRCVSLCVDIGGIDNHHCLNFLFIIGQVDTLRQSDTLCLECQCETQLNISTIDYFNVKHSWLFLPLTTSMWNTSDYFCHWLLHCETQLTISTFDYFNVKHSWILLPLNTSMWNTADYFCQWLLQVVCICISSSFLYSYAFSKWCYEQHIASHDVYFIWRLILCWAFLWQCSYDYFTG